MGYFLTLRMGPSGVPLNNVYCRMGYIDRLCA